MVTKVKHKLQSVSKTRTLLDHGILSCFWWETGSNTYLQPHIPLNYQDFTNISPKILHKL